MNLSFMICGTTGKNKDWSQIIQFGAIYLNQNFEELDRFEIKCRLKAGVVPEPEALIVNNTSENLRSFNYSHYELIKSIKDKIEHWSPAYFFGYNSINFDEEILRKVSLNHCLMHMQPNLKETKEGTC